jgi:hypothetical protein
MNFEIPKEKMLIDWHTDEGDICFFPIFENTQDTDWIIGNIVN